MLRQHNQQLVRAVVDLKDRSMARGTEPPPNEALLKIPPESVSVGNLSSVGQRGGYSELRVITVRGDPLISEGGNAELEQGVTVLRLALKTAMPASGRYVLQIRRLGSEWASFPLEIR